MIKIFLTNLGKYNEGILSGEWVELPASDEEIQAVKDRTGYDETHEEYFITDYESDIDGLRIGEYDDIDELNKLAEITEDEPEKAAALIYFGYTDADDIAENLDNVCYICTPDGFESDDFAVGYYYAHECGCLNIPDELEPYFDYEAYGRDIDLNGSFYTAENGDIYELIA